VPAASLLARKETPATRGLLREMVEWARELMHAGAPLARALPGRAGWELRLVVQGGLRVLEKIEHIDYATLRARPVLRAWDGLVMLWRSL
jgi:phytoene/squalene synthetase